MNATEFLTRALEIANKHKVKELFFNEKKEFFLSENLASLSVGGDKEKYKSMTVSEMATALAVANKDGGNGYGKMTNKDLLALATERGLPVDPKANKSALIAALEEADKGTGSETPPPPGDQV